MKFNLYLGIVASSWLLFALVVAAELFSPFKTFLAALFSHHWIAKAVLITIAFFAFGLLFANRKKWFELSERDAAWYSVLASFILIFIFYVVEFLT